MQKIRNGLNAVGVTAIAGRVSGTILTQVADLMEAAGADRARLTAYQKLIILDVPDEKVDELVDGLDALGLSARPSRWRQNLMACTGIEYCKLSFADTRGRAQVLVPELRGPSRRPQCDARRAGDRQHQRLPQLVRPHPGRRHRLQGPDGGRR